ncbi:MAG: hypothetical protein IJN29_02920 [Akkermansia sp.]|nr:hypothetical protein [Akkermansia sp.]
MIPVQKQPEPDDFAHKVSEPGEAWLKKQRFYDASAPEKRSEVPDGTTFPPLWSKCAEQLYDRYRGICAYLAIRVYRGSGAESVDHFLPKKYYPGLAYSWDNYRFSCLGKNRSKSAYEHILDPFTLPPDTFRIDLMTGEIYPSPSAPQEIAIRTRDVLKLNDGCHCAMRLELMKEYQSGGISAEHCKRNYPFIWIELVRNGLAVDE